jgi:hypothetical protein
MVLHGQGRHEPKGTIHASPLPPSPLPTTTAVILPLPFPRLTPRAHVFVDGCVQNIPIKEGEMFMLPAHTPHSPQRFADTVSETERRWPPLSYALQVGIVMERKRLPGETDHLRWYCDKCCAVVYEESFFCTDLGSQLKVNSPSPRFCSFFLSPTPPSPSSGSLSSSATCPPPACACAKRAATRTRPSRPRPFHLLLKATLDLLRRQHAIC